MEATKSRFAFPVEIKMNGQREMDKLKRYVNKDVMVVSINPSGDIEAYMNKLERVEDFKYLKLSGKEPIPFMPNKAGDGFVMEVMIIKNEKFVPIYENILVKNSSEPGSLKRRWEFGREMLRKLSF